MSSNLIKRGMHLSFKFGTYKQDKLRDWESSHTNKVEGNFESRLYSLKYNNLGYLSEFSIYLNGKYLLLMLYKNWINSELGLLEINW